MTQPQKKASSDRRQRIRRLVLEILREEGLVKPPAENRAPHRNKTGPTVLCVFHPGVRRLEAALAQVRRIEALAGRAGVFTVDAARQWVCRRDVREKAGSRCILDTVGTEGIEKVLERADVLVLPTFCFQTAVRVAQMAADDQGSALVLTALAANKPVLAANDGFTLLDRMANPAMAREMQRVLEKLARFGMQLCETERLAEHFEKLTRGTGRARSAGESRGRPERGATGRRLISAEDVRQAREAGADRLTLSAGGIVTPLACDLAREYGLRIVTADAPEK